MKRYVRSPFGRIAELGRAINGGYKYRFLDSPHWESGYLDKEYLLKGWKMMAGGSNITEEFLRKIPPISVAEDLQG